MKPTNYFIALFLLISLSVVGQVNTPQNIMTLQPQIPQQVVNDINALRTITAGQCNEAKLALRNEIVNRSNPYIGRYSRLQYAILRADDALMNCFQSCLDDKNNLVSQVGQLNSELENAEAYQNSYRNCQDNLQDANETTITISVIGGSFILILIVIWLKVRSVREIFKNVFEKILDTVQEKLLDAAVAALEDETWKKKFGKIQDLYTQYKQRKIKAEEFERRLNEILAT
ncbi:hypothetical protein JMN32_08665 [Fulvivirga sp. 29W222]|uniref:Uncharacterized protein n=1 Tax=Fulvivirga marina TaxID=2494733 RepID=A0A937FWN6_9BACT|nr:hypothetical protein [Fulvivirga marina]MBL6446377.1 hypothetical protein [Fulvivirga marina]